MGGCAGPQGELRERMRGAAGGPRGREAWEDGGDARGRWGHMEGTPRGSPRCRRLRAHRARLCRAHA